MQDIEQPIANQPDKTNTHNLPQSSLIEEQVTQPPKISKYLGFILLSLALIVLSGAAYYFWWYSSRVGQISQTMPLPEPITTSSAPPAPVPTPYVDNEIFWKVVDRQTNTVIVDKTEYDRDVAYKAPHLYFRNKDNSQELIQLNLDTGEQKILYSDDTTRTINSIQLINNTIFFTTGGYMEGGALFYLDENGSVLKLDEHEYGGGSIQEEAGNYWLVGGTGDSCWGQSRYSLLTFNPQPILTPKVESHFGCNDGEEVLALKSDYILMTEHKVDESIEAMGFPASLFSSIFTRSIQDPQQKIELVPTSAMPEQVQSVEYHEKENTLWLVGNTPAVYDITSNQVQYFDQALPFIPSSWGGGSWGISETESEKMTRSEIGYCVEHLGENQAFIRGYILNFQSQAIEQLSSPCPQALFPATDYDAESKERIQLKFKELGLPEKYSLEIYQTEVIY